MKRRRNRIVVFKIFAYGSMPADVVIVRRETVGSYSNITPSSLRRCQRAQLALAGVQPQEAQP